MVNRTSTARLGTEIRSLWSTGAVGLKSDRDLLENFIQGGDKAELAFGALVERHGRTVLQVCRNILGDCHLAADSFQVTFLILARRADSIHDPASLEHWLHRVARRVAIRARAAADRRKLGQFGKSADVPVNHLDPLEHDEIRAIVREEIDRLDDALRVPIVLCALEGFTHEEAAERLQWPVGTVKSRLVRGRRQLKRRLARRGLAPALALAVAGRARAAALVATPRTLAAATSRLVFGGAARTGTFTNSAAWLLGQELRAMTYVKLKVAAASLMGAVAVMFLGVAMAEPFGPRRPTREAQLPSAKQIAAEATKSSRSDQEKADAAVKLAAHGRVLDAAGRPVAGAGVFIREWAIMRTMGMTADRSEKLWRGEEIADILAQSTTDENGRFRFAGVDAPPFPYASVAGKGYYPWDLVAIAPGHGVAWTQLTRANQQSEISLRLPAEGTLRGRLVEPGGKPIAGARIKVFGVYPLGDLDARAEDDPARLDLTWSSIPLVTSSGADGAFTLRGLPREIQTPLVITDPHHERTLFYAATTRHPQPDVSDYRGQSRADRNRVYLEDFTLTLKSSDHRLVGRAVLEASGQPAAGTRVSWKHGDCTADGDGKFVLENLPAGDIELHLEAPLPAAAPLETHVNFSDETTALERTFKLPPGMALTGRAVDSESAAGIGDFGVAYRPQLDVSQRPTRTSFTVRTGADGRFRLAVPAGRGVLEVWKIPGHYHLAGFKPGGPNRQASLLRELRGKPGDTLEVPEYRLVGEKPFLITVRDPAGNPVAGAEVVQRASQGQFEPSGRTDAAGRCELNGVDRENGFTLDVTQHTKPLGRRVVVKADDLGNAKTDGMTEVTLEPCGTLVGRVLGDDGKPMVFATVRLYADVEFPESGHSRSLITTDVREDGTFRFDRLIAGVSYRINILGDGHATWLGKTSKVTPGDNQSAGEIRLPWADQQVRGLVVDARGEMIVGATVGYERDPPREEIHPPSGRHWVYQTNDYGAFRLSGLPRGTIRLIAYRRAAGDRLARQKIRVEARAGATDVRIVLPDVDDRLRGVE